MFDPKARCSLKKKRKSSPEFGNYFLQFDHCHCPKISDFAQIFSCHCPKNFNFAQILETWVGNCPPCPPPPPGRYGYDWLYRCFIFYSKVKIRTIN